MMLPFSPRLYACFSERIYDRTPGRLPLVNFDAGGPRGATLAHEADQK